MWLCLLLAGCTGDSDDGTPTADTAVTTTDPTVIDVFVQDIITPIDILWVVDGQWTDGLTALDDALDKTFEPLLLADPSWRMGVLNADVSNNMTRGLIGSVFEAYPPPGNAFNIVAAGPPKVREAVYTAFDERVERNEDFLRPEADLFILVYTDQEDQSDDSVISEADFITWLDALELSQDKRIGALTTSNAGAAWRQLANSTGGLVYEVGAFKKGLSTLMLEAIGQEIEFRLSETPQNPPDEVVVVYREKGTEYVRGEDFEYFADSNTIVFTEYVPPPGSQVRVTYLPYVEGGTTSPTDGGTTSSK